ncbi:MAG: glycosyltransferase [Bacteroidota bacterium]
MLSVLIPIFNFDCTSLVIEIINQCNANNLTFEVITIDDFSNSDYKEKNKNLSIFQNTKYSELPSNIGRSKIRNLLAKTASYDNLLFLDCDSEIENTDFIKNYIPYFNNNKVVYGGRCYKNQTPKEKKEILRWKYGIKRETISAEQRKTNTYLYFLTNNFLCSKNTFNSVQFNENLVGYGHEDTLFAQELKKKNIEILHVENALTHVGLETTELFLSKTKEGISNLFKAAKSYNLNTTEIKLYRNFERLNKFKLSAVYLFFYSLLIKKIIEKNLHSQNPSLFFFDLFKLYWCCKIAQELSKGE